jgi:hypothetical protein
MRAAKGTVKRWVEKTLASDTDACVEWPFAMGAHRAGGAYGKVGGVQFGFKGPMDAHRLMCILAHGSPPSLTHEAAHSCGNRACVNKRHLRWATPKENKTDELSHGTRNRGERHGHAKLSKSDVLFIRDARDHPSDIGFAFGVSETTVRDIKSKRTWAWL